MKKVYADKSLKQGKAQAKAPVTDAEVGDVYAFPQYQISIRATSLEKAQAELQKQLASAGPADADKK